MAKQTASAVHSTDKKATQETDYSKDVYYNKLDLGERQIFKNWLLKNLDGTPQKFYELRKKATSKAKTTPTEGIANHDGTFITFITKEEAGKLHAEGKKFANETGNG